MFKVNLKLPCLPDEMDCGVEQIDGPTRTCSPSCEQRDAGREGQGDADSRQRGDMGRPRIKLPQRSDMICGYASLKGQRICKFVSFAILGWTYEGNVLFTVLKIKKGSVWGNECCSRDVQ